MSSPCLIESLPDADLDGHFSVLVVDDDRACLEEYVEMVTSLGYDCQAALDPLVALRHIASDPKIAILISDVHMPRMDGISFLEEAAFRYFDLRPMAAIAITGEPTLEIAISAMRTSAVDFLTKPVSRKDLASALRRAAARVGAESDRHKLKALAAASILQTVQSAEDPPTDDTLSISGAPTHDQLLALVRSIVKGRRARFEFLNEELFSDPSWDILLELTAAALEGRPIPSSSLCEAASAPMTTALRHITKLNERGLIKRWPDPTHKRRILFELEPHTFEAMKKYLNAHWQRRNIATIPPGATKLQSD